MMYFYMIKYCKTPTILILDSGVGGLFVYQIIYKIFPGAFYLYVFDNRFFPYGELTESFIIQRVIFIIKTIFNQHQCDLVIIACNTISVVALKILRTQFCFPIIGIVPEIKLAMKYTKNGVIGVLGTRRTIHNNYFVELIKYFEYQYTMILLGTSELVKLAEYKMHGKLVLKSELKKIFRGWLNLKKFPDTLVLGCTHFSLLKKELIEFFPSVSYVIDSEIYCNTYIKFYLHQFFKIDHTLDSQILSNHNLAYCTMYSIDIQYLKLILLLQYNFFSLEVLSI